MSRAVGGASAVGCGVFGLGSLIVGIGLTVWLGSQVMSAGTDGGGSGPNPTQPTELPGATITIAPDPYLAEGSSVTLTGTGLLPGPIDLAACLATPPSDGSRRCAADGVVRAEVASDGSFELRYPVARVLTVGEASYDCAAWSGACVLLAHRPDDPLEAGTSAPLTFPPDLPPVDAQPPPGG